MKKMLLIAIFVASAVSMTGCIHRAEQARQLVLPDALGGIAIEENGFQNTKDSAVLVCRLHPAHLKGHTLYRIRKSNLEKINGVMMADSMNNAVSERLRASLNEKIGGTVWLNTMSKDANIICDFLELTDVDGIFRVNVEVAIRNSKNFSQKRIRLVNEWPAGKDIEELLKNYAEALDWVAEKIAAELK